MNEDTRLVVMPSMPIMSIAESVERRNAMVEFVKTVMRSGVDYGVIPGTDKPTLLKPGSEKLCTLFGLSSRFLITDKIMDWGDIEREPLFYFSYRCQLSHGDQLVAEGEGSCNSREKKYRYRKAQQVCPNCGQPTIFKSKNKPEFYCWSKRGGCGATFPLNEKRIIDQETGQIVNPDIADQLNTIQKMAQKRALIAATLIAVNASEFFTQDLDDMIIEGEVIEHGPAWTEPIASAQEANAEIPAEAPAPANGKSPKLAVLKTPNFQKLVEAVNAKTGHYKTPDHMRAAAVSKLNFPEITDKNLSAVTEALVQYGLEQDAIKTAPK